MHVQVDAPPHVLEDEIGLQLVAPDEGWRGRPDMDPRATRLFRASSVARARFIEDLVVKQASRGVGQYVIPGAGVDTFAQRRPEIASGLRIFEVDQPGPQAWKRRRLIALGFGIPEWLRLVPVDFEAGGSWWERIKEAGFEAGQPAVVASTGVSMYLTASDQQGLIVLEHFLRTESSTSARMVWQMSADNLSRLRLIAANSRSAPISCC